MSSPQAGTATGSFPLEVKTRALVACKRFCCLCEKPSGVKMHCHHIVPVAKGGPDTFENCIPICLNCHAEVEAYNDKHPLGNKFRPEELRQRRDMFYKAVQLGPVLQQQAGLVEADRLTLVDLQQMLPSNGTIDFIRSFTFGYSFREENLEDIEKFLGNRSGPEHEFLDEELEAQRKDLRKKINTFLRLVGENTFTSGRNCDRLEVPPEWERQDSKRYWDALRALGKASDEVCKSYDAMIRMARRKLA